MNEPASTDPEWFQHIDLGLMGYAQAYAIQEAAVLRVVSAREGQPAPHTTFQPVPRALVHTVEHPPIITVTRRAKENGHVLATPELLQQFGIELHDTDRGGDVTYHGPGQVVIYPIIDLNFFNLGLHDYMRLLEDVVIDACANWGINAVRDSSATGVWIDDGSTLAKVCAMGVRVRKWVSMHGLAINVAPNMSHFSLIVPCGLAGRPVTSLHAQLGSQCPTLDQVRLALVSGLQNRLLSRHPAH